MLDHIVAYHDVGDRLGCHQHAEKCRLHTFLSPTTKNGRHHQVTNITMSPTSLLADSRVPGRWVLRSFVPI